jgi:molecular chaperone HtpG
MAKGSLSINTDNILPIIKKWLYSDKDIFLRELVSNSCDAIAKLKLLQSNKEAEKLSDPFQINISINKDQKTITITDNGLGMTKTEVEKYIAEIAFSGAEDFLKKYNTQNEKDQIIGHFGLGFYSAYMVAKKVEIHSKSYQKESEGVFWSCDGSSTYEISTSSFDKTGTSIILYLSDESLDFLEKDKIVEILKKYCPYLPYPIFVDNLQINSKDPLWLKASSECSDEDYLAFYRELYPFETDPIFWIHLNVDFPFHLKGILYFPKIGSNFDISKNSVKLFCNRVFVSDNCRDILPDYLTILRGAIDSPDIPLNVSRSHLQMDSTVKKLGQHISKKITDRLSALYTSSRENFISSWPDIEMIVKLAILQDEKFYERSSSFLLFKNTKNEWTTAQEYLERNKEKLKDKIFYVTEQDSHFLSLFKEKEIEVIYTNSHVDIAVLNFLETKLSLKFQRIDGDIDESILDPSKEKTLLDSSGKSLSANIADFFRQHLSEVEVQAKSLSSDTITAFLLLKEDERRLRDYFNLTKQDLQNFPTQKTLVINTNSKLVNKAYELKTKNLDLAKDLVLQIYNLALLSQKELNPTLLPNFIAHSTAVLEKLVEKA